MAHGLTYSLKDKFSAEAGIHPGYSGRVFLSQSDLQKKEHFEKHSEPDSHGQQDAEDDAEYLREQLLDILDGIGQTIVFSYSNPEFNAYKDFSNSEQWQDYSNKAVNDWSAAASTVVIVGSDGEVYYGVGGADGDSEYYRINENGSTTRVFDKDSISIPDGAETFDPLAVGAGKTLYKRMSERGEIEFVNRQGEKIDDSTVQKARDALAKTGKVLEDSTIFHEDLKNANLGMDTVHKVEKKDGEAQDNLNAAERNLSQNYTPENFLDREMKKINQIQAGIDAKRESVASLPQSEETKLNEAEDTLAADRQKLEKLKTQLAGKTPEEANKIMTATFGDKYDTKLAQQAIGQKQQVAETIAVPGSSIGARSGLQTDVNMRADFSNAAKGTDTAVTTPKPVPAAAPQAQQLSL